MSGNPQPTPTPPLPRAPSIARAGLVLPGLGHVLTGDLANGVPLLMQTWLLVWSVVAGGPRLRELLFPTSQEGGTQLHPWVALVGWVALAAGLWWMAWRRAHPRQVDPRAPRTPWQDLQRQFVKSNAGVLGLHLVLLLVTLSLLTPFIAPYNYYDIDVGPKYTPPGWEHLMGTDRFGRDVFSRVLYGGRISLVIGLLAVSVSATIGTLVGAVAGYLAGWVDGALMWVVELLMALPRLVLLLAIVGFFQSGGTSALAAMVIILGFTGWMGVARIVRAQVLSLKEQDFVAASRALGLPMWRILLRHIVPNTLAPIIVYASLAIGSTILVESSLSFLGFGVSPPTATWGAIVSDGKDDLLAAPWISTAPGLIIVIAVMSFNLLGDGLRDALDPKMRGRG